MSLVSLVVVSHSRSLAVGVAELAGQMAPGVAILTAGGMSDGGLGTSFDLVESALLEATADGGEAVVLTDLGSAVLTAESVLETLDDEVAARVVLADAPLVEGAVAAAVAAQVGATRDGVLVAAQAAGHLGAPDPAELGAAAPADPEQRTTVEVVNPLGLHARPAAVLARAMAAFDAQVSVDGVDAASVLQLMGLAATKGRVLTLAARGPQAHEALDAAVAMISGGFGEV